MKKLFTGTILTAAPLVMFAQANAFSILGTIADIINFLIPILITAAVAYFIWGVITYVIAKDADDKEKARDVVVRGIIGFFVILSIWGLVAILQSTFGIGSGGAVGPDNIPRVIN
jgi:hypothetical protein